MGPSTGPDVPIFRQFQKQWDSIDQTTYIDYKSYAASRDKLGPIAESTMTFAQQKIEVIGTIYREREVVFQFFTFTTPKICDLQSGQPRDDYLELLEVIILFLGGTPPRGGVFRLPGPIHSARWMAKAIYCIKMTMFRKQLGLPTKDLDNLLQLTIFIIRVYARGWYSCTSSVEAPSNDLKFLKELLEYEKVHKVIAKVAQKRFTYHLWYLSEELVSFSVFDENLSDSERAGIVDGILHREGSEDPPKKRAIDMREVRTMSLKDLSTTCSLNFFTILGIDTGFFEVPVSEWGARNDYQAGRLIATHLRVVNDHAERGVKLMSDYNRSVTKNEESFQHLLVNVEQHRRSIPDYKKSTLIKKYDKSH
jgi:hypothetical protein